MYLASPEYHRVFLLWILVLLLPCPGQSFPVQVFGRGFYFGSDNCTGTPTLLAPDSEVASFPSFQVIDFCYNILGTGSTGEQFRSRVFRYIAENSTLEQVVFHQNDCVGPILGTGVAPITEFCTNFPAKGFSESTNVFVADFQDLTGIAQVASNVFTNENICFSDIRSAALKPEFASVPGIFAANAVHVLVGTCVPYPSTDGRFSVRVGSGNTFVEFSSLNCSGDSSALAPGCYCCSSVIPVNETRYYGALPSNFSSVSTSAPTEVPTQNPTQSPEPKSTSEKIAEEQVVESPTLVAVVTTVVVVSSAASVVATTASTLSGALTSAISGMASTAATTVAVGTSAGSAGASVGTTAVQSKSHSLQFIQIATGIF